MIIFNNLYLKCAHYYFSRRTSLTPMEPQRFHASCVCTKVCVSMREYACTITPFAAGCPVGQNAVNRA